MGARRTAPAGPGVPSRFVNRTRASATRCGVLCNAQPFEPLLEILAACHKHLQECDSQSRPNLFLNLVSRPRHDRRLLRRDSRLGQRDVANQDRAAITLSAIAVRTEREHRMTVLAQANALSENHFAVCRHASPQGGLDTGRRFVAP